jgi:cinnamyl-alcohol dehydrogenase
LTNKVFRLQKPETDPVVVPVPDELALRVKRILERFKEITKAWNDLQLDEADAPLREDEQDFLPMPTTPYVDEPTVIGRDDEKNNIVKMLLSMDGSHGEKIASILPIIGMGGVGKTTLAQLVYNDRRITKQFDLMGWIHVSENFDLKNIMSKIIMSFTRKPCQITELDQLEYMLMDQVAGRKFLLVLDDVWSERKDLWDALLSPMSAAQLGAILVTTRNVNVSSVIQTMAPYHVGCLPFDESWQIFKQMAFGHLDQNIEKAFEEIGRKIVQKCGGLPLAVKAIGSVLRFEENEEKWSDILDSELWDLPTGEDTVLPALRLSYVRMPIDLKRCFVLFTLFPKGHIFMKENVVYLWISLGILKQNNHRHLENIGNQYFDDLLQRTMVQRVQIDGGHNCFTIHDLFLDLAKFVSGEDILKLDTQHMLYLNDASRNVRYLSFAVSSSDHTNLDLRTLPVTGSIRILQVINAMDDNKRYYSSLFKNNRRCFSKLFSHHINITLPEDLRGLRHLRALDLSRSSLTSLPESIGELKLLRYLSIFQTRIAKLPESICGLYNLKVLDARTNMLGEIPQGIQKLVSLQHLSLDLWSPLCMPRGIGELKKLKTLTRYSVGTGNWHCNIAELHHLVNIHGELSITGLSRVTNINDAQTANLISKRHLKILRLDWSAGFYATECEHTVNQNNATSTPEFEEEVFESLKPQRNLEELEVVEYSGYKYPSWMGDPAFSCLAKVTLWKQKCKFLPALGQLPQLHELVVIHMEGVERIGQEFYGQDSTERFPALELLEFQDMPKWVEWYDIAESDFPSLRELKIKDSNELRVLPQKLPAHLKKLVITNCEKLIRPPIAPSLTSLVLKGNIHEETLSCLHFPLLRTLKVCFLRTAKFIKLENMPMLEGLAIVGCRQLFSVAGLSNLESLSLLNIKGCPNLHLPFEPLPQKVQQATVTNCPQLQEWAEWQQAQMPKHEHQV